MSKQPINWMIHQIKETDFNADESGAGRPGGALNYTVQITPHVPGNLLHFYVTITFYAEGNRDVLLKSCVVTSYFFEDMAKLVRGEVDGKEKLDLPKSLWVELFGLAFSHTRAMLVRSTEATAFGPRVLPVINPEKEFMKLFGAQLLGERASD